MQILPQDGLVGNRVYMEEEEEEEEEEEDEGVEGVGEGDEESTDSMVSASQLPSTFKPDIYSR